MTMTWTYTVYDGKTWAPWPTHQEADLDCEPGDDIAFALRDAVLSAASGCGYAPGDEIVGRAWSRHDGRCVEVRVVLTADDLY